MSENFSYQDYVTDEAFLASYNDYQSRYAERIRESDKVIINAINEIIAKNPGKRLSVLDIGCSTGNLLLHLSRLAPGADYLGGDLAESSLKVCRNNVALKGIEFKRLDILELDDDIKYDIVVANAVAVYFTWPEYERCLKSVFNALKPGGTYIVFEWMHPYSCQDLTIYESSLGHPGGMRICFRPIQKVNQKLIETGFSKAVFHPFQMPYDLHKPGYEEEVVSYTETLQSGERLTFRGALYQPWCHMMAYKA
ncbi:MAG: class I SAM-dependent methyltransferase [Leptolyngbyaceae cyanobacterium RM2_2_4]|nr:class I SAM-dependent methyltransferase [bacterium]NJO53376.1 class I SAM-dependent methyltransferase [Leptolyngbyaceae cyanobacterium RM2_2_4]